MLQYKRVLEQYIAVESNRSKSGASLRDNFMAENVEWIVKHNSGKKALVWAHNGHIIKKTDNKGIIRMGEKLKSKYNDQYYAIGMLFNRGEFRAVNLDKKQLEVIKVRDALPHSIDYFFSKGSNDVFFLDFSTIKSLPLHTKVNQLSKSRIIGEGFSPKNEARYYYHQYLLPESYDAVLFINQTTASQRLDFMRLK